MKLPLRYWIVLGILALSACVPTKGNMERTEWTVELGYSDTYDRTTELIRKQPGEWEIARADQEGGFITARLQGYRCEFDDCRTPFVSIALTHTSENQTTSIALGYSMTVESLKLVKAIQEDPKLRPRRPGF